MLLDSKIKRKKKTFSSLWQQKDISHKINSIWCEDSSGSYRTNFRCTLLCFIRPVQARASAFKNTSLSPFKETTFPISHVRPVSHRMLTSFHSVVKSNPYVCFYHISDQPVFWATGYLYELSIVVSALLSCPVPRDSLARVPVTHTITWTFPARETWGENTKRKFVCVCHIQSGVALLDWFPGKFLDDFTEALLGKYDPINIILNTFWRHLRLFTVRTHGSMEFIF